MQGTRWTVHDPAEVYTAEAAAARAASVRRTSGNRTQDTYEGGRIISETYPYWDTRPANGVRAKKLKPSRAAAKKQNEKDAKRRFCGLLDANFGPRDIHFTGTYDRADGELPDYERAMKDIRNFILRWRRARKAAGLSKGDYMYVTEGDPSGRQVRSHTHIILEGGLDRDLIESLWTHGRASAERLQPDDYGLLGLGKYLSKDPKGKKRWGASRGLKQPRVEVRDNKITRRDVATIERDRYAAREIVAKKYPGYMIRDPEQDVQVRYSPYVGGAYVTMVLTPIEGRAAYR